VVGTAIAVELEVGPGSDCRSDCFRRSGTGTGVILSKDATKGVNIPRTGSPNVDFRSCSSCFRRSRFASFLAWA